jgi:hypothetical protein
MRRRPRDVMPVRPPMDTDLIGMLDHTTIEGSFVNAVLFAGGELKSLKRSADVFGLVLAGYEGLQFGDDGTYTALVASELPLQRWVGVHKLEESIDRAAQMVNPGYRAQHVGFIALDQAAVELDVALKRELGVPFPAVVNWRGGSFATGGGTL